ncbi:glycoside hydrolase family 3 [Burkholderia sp. ABCPW 11]|uniref:glycoside hydrolase family 3 protein n=1 Tax=Burkholderia sp. ABCPW 11 TaxID=1637859 RepID=UPI00075B0AAB|nr:glycoside hydrolase family 3 N-terminal domain-containing protein [Burkholderia sp. ABCPW 11]KVD46812.1 glycoside hydrolase family 3 [Burkholderia sp. ABCPW 11]
MNDELLRKSPFNLGDVEIEWVRKTFAQLTRAERISQLFILLLLGTREEDFDLVRRLKPGGVTRFFTSDIEYERSQLASIIDSSTVPPVITADLEGSRQSFPFGTAVLNQLGLAAVNDVDATQACTRILASEGRALGIRWSFTPVIDINAAFRSAIVGTRSFGSDIARIERHALAHIRGMQETGVAATVKHWPGEGFDDRDQHLVTTINPLDVDTWERHFGRLYRTMINAGVMSVMSGHIAFPAYVKKHVPDAGVEAYRPASINYLLNQKLLREELGFNGLIVSDATEMAGLGAWCDRTEAIPQIIASGCDVVLFSIEPEKDMAAIDSALANGTLEESRFNEAVVRMLGMKAALRLHDPSRPLLAPPDSIRQHFAKPESTARSSAVIARSPTLVKDTQSIFPLDPAVSRRVLFITNGITHPLVGPAEFALPDLLRDEGFTVVAYDPSLAVSPDDFDLVIYALGDESLLTRSRIFIDWASIGGGIGRAMERYWHRIPTVMISFGHPYHLYDAPRVPTYINAYSTLHEVQKAVVECLLGRQPWNTDSPVDAFCGLGDARF